MALILLLYLSSKNNKARLMELTRNVSNRMSTSIYKNLELHNYPEDKLPKLVRQVIRSENLLVLYISSTKNMKIENYH